MPAQRVSKGFKDLSMSFKFNPLSGDLIALKNENAIARAVRNIVSTTPGEKFFDPDLDRVWVKYYLKMLMILLLHCRFEKKNIY